MVEVKDTKQDSLTDSVGADEAEDVPRPGHGQPVQLERVRRVSVRGLLLQVGRQVDDGDGLEGALLDADAAADAQLLADVGDLVVGRHLDAQLAHAHHRAGLLALLPAALGLAPVIVDDGDTGEHVAVVGVLAVLLGTHGEGQLLGSHGAYCTVRFVDDTVCVRARSKLKK